MVDDAHPSQRLDDVVHQRVRLGILAVLAEADEADFGFLKDSLNLTDGNLSRHLQVLEEAGFVEVNKVFVGRRPRTWIAATKAGRAAFAAEVAALRELIAGTERFSQGSAGG
ncbi:MAG: winged helix-turn-helix domain-containing protein [Acidimicrobiales bacterium]